MLFPTVPKKRGRHGANKAASSTVAGIEDNITPSFYSTKRLKNDYYTNPLKQDMTQLTGITTADNSSNVNYHLSSGIITHKLIQSMGEVYMDICVQKQELDDYSCLDDLQNDHLKFFSNEDEKIIKEYETVLRTNNDNLNRSHELEVENNLKFSQIETLEKDIETLKGSLMAQGETLSKLKDAFVKTDNVQDEIEKEERISVSRDTEKKYMEQEIKRAVDAIRENEEETHKLNEKQNGLESELKLRFEKSEISTKELNEKIGFLKKELKLENDLNEELVGQLSKTMDNLENLTIPRVRTQNGNTKKKSRAKNQEMYN